jgi:hypothetical protein
VEIVSPTSFFGVSLSKSSCAVEYLTMAEEDDGSVAKRRSLGTVHFSDVALDTGYTLFTTDTQVKNVTLRVSDASLSEMMATVRNEADQFSAQFKGSTTTSGSYLVTSCNTVAGLGYFSYPLKLSMHNDLSSARTPLVDASKSIWKSVSEARPASVWRSISRSLNKQSDDDSDSSNKLPKLFRSNKKTLRKLYHDMKTAYTNNLLNVLGQVLIEFPEFAFEFVNNGNASDLADVVSYFTASGGMVDLSDPHFDPKGELLCHGIASFAGATRSRWMTCLRATSRTCCPRSCTMSAPAPTLPSTFWSQELTMSCRSRSRESRLASILPRVSAITTSSTASWQATMITVLTMMTMMTMTGLPVRI